MADKNAITRVLCATRGRQLSAQGMADEIPCVEQSDPRELCTSPLVSVLMITYNHQAYIGEAIAGVVTQRCDFDFELIIGEDCSPDRTRAICFEFQKKYPHVIRMLYSDTNVGAFRNSIRCQHRVRGKYVAFCEGDDYWCDSGKLQKQIMFLEKHRKYGIVGSTAIHLAGGKYARPRVQRDRDVQVSINYNHFTTCTVCVRADLLNEYSNTVKPLYYNEVMGDYPAWLWFGLVSRSRLMGRPMAVYRILAESASHSGSAENNLRFVESQNRVALSFLPLMPKWQQQVFFILCGHLICTRRWMAESQSVMPLYRHMYAHHAAWITRRYLDCFRRVCAAFPRCAARYEQCAYNSVIWLIRHA